MAVGLGRSNEDLLGSIPLLRPRSVSMSQQGTARYTTAAREQSVRSAHKVLLEVHAPMDEVLPAVDKLLMHFDLITAGAAAAA